MAIRRWFISVFAETRRESDLSPNSQAPFDHAIYTAACPRERQIFHVSHPIIRWICWTAGAVSQPLGSFGARVALAEPRLPTTVVTPCTFGGSQ
jgi:hypothetical protein